MIHSISFILLTLCALFLPVWVFAIFAFFYACVFTPYELLILGMCVDAVFGDPNTGVWFMYTLIVAVILIGAVFIKPYLRFYE